VQKQLPNPLLPSRYYAGLVTANCLLIGLAIVLYNESFDLIRYPISYSGTWLTEHGNPNHLSALSFGGAMAISAGVMFVIANAYAGTAQRHRASLSLMAAIGFVFATFSPNDLRHETHALGSTFAITALWLIALTYLQEIGPYTKPPRYLFLFCVLNVPLIAYATTNFLNKDEPSFMLQKFALAGLAFVLMLSVRLAEQHQRGYCRTP